MLPLKKWERKKFDNKLFEKLSSQLNCSSLEAKVLCSRGITDTDDIKSYFSDDVSSLYSPFLLKDMDKSVKRIVKALENKEKITIYGDYDVDGITATSALVDFLRALGGNADYYIPSRLEEGYGLSVEGIERGIREGTSLFITVDCGITAMEEVEYCNEKGIDIIVTDHHNCKFDKNGNVIIPNAYAVINAKQPDCGYPNKELCGAAVSFKLICAICECIDQCDLSDKYIEFATLGTVADAMKLIGENRVIVKEGLKRISNSEFHSIRQILTSCDLNDKEITADTIAFYIAPKINAVGRMANATQAVEFFIQGDLKKLEDMSEKFFSYNALRQEEEKKVLTEAVDIIENSSKLKESSFIVVCGENWHRGIIGIVASRIAEMYARPCIVISIEEGIGRGSARSVNGINIYDIISNASHVLMKFGGHEFAGGITIKEDKIEEFIDIINKDSSAENKEEYSLMQTIDAVLDKEELVISSIDNLKKFEPFGFGNLHPLFEVDNVNIINCNVVGDGKHLKLKIKKDNVYIDVIAFNLGKIYSEVKKLTVANITGHLEINCWKGFKNIQMRMTDIEKA